MLHLGCGRDIKPGMLNVDSRPLPGVDVVLDLDGDWPWETDSVRRIECNHVLEHVRDLIGFMDKAHAVLKKDGMLCVRVPHHRHRNADTDPTHIRFFTEHSFDYWMEETQFESFSDLKWVMVRKEVRGGHKIPLLWRLHPSLRYLYLLPPHEILFVLSPVKE